LLCWFLVFPFKIDRYCASGFEPSGRRHFRSAFRLLPILFIFYEM
jgi:hypothetical protein